MRLTARTTAGAKMIDAEAYFSIPSIDVGQRFEEPGFELLTVGAIVDPVAGRGNSLSGRAVYGDKGRLLAVSVGGGGPFP